MKIGRNDPCPCGSRNLDKSRKKYKKCCIGRTPIFLPKKAQELSRITIESEKEEHARFLKAHNQGICYGCSLPYDEYDETKLPCAHWLLRPKGIKKGKGGHREHNHYHRPNPDSKSKYDKYLDENGNPVRDGHESSHLYRPEDAWWKKVTEPS